MNVNRTYLLKICTLELLILMMDEIPLNAVPFWRKHDFTVETNSCESVMTVGMYTKALDDILEYVTVYCVASIE